MELNKNNIEEFVHEYVLGRLDEKTTAIFESLLIQNTQVQEEVAQLQQSIEGIDHGNIPEMSKEADANFYASLRAEVKKQEEKKRSLFDKISSFFKFEQNNRIGQLAFGMALLVLGFLAGSFFTENEEKTGSNELASTETEMVRSQLVLELVAQPSAGKRLQPVNEANKLQNATDTVIHALFTMLNNDSNVNVRLAAIESLSKYAEKPFVRKGLVTSIISQESPLVQIALADLMVSLQEPSSIKSMEQLLEQPNINDAVKQKLEKSIQEII